MRNSISLLFVFLLAGCLAEPQTDRPEPASGKTGQALSQLAPDSLTTVAVVLEAEGPEWRLATLTMNQTSVAMLGGLIQWGYVIAAPPGTSASFMLAVHSTHSDQERVRTYFQAAPEGTSVVGARGLSTNDPEGSYEFAFALSANGPGKVNVSLGIIPPENLDQRWSGLPLLLERNAVAIKADHTGAGLVAGSYWHLQDSTGFGIDYRSGTDCTVSGPAGESLDCRATLPSEGGWAAFDYSARWQTGTWSWNASLGDAVGSGVFAHAPNSAAEILLATPGQASNQWASTWHWEGQVPSGALTTAFNHQAVHASFTTIPDPASPGPKEEFEIVNWGFFGGDLSQMLGWPKAG